MTFFGRHAGQSRFAVYLSIAVVGLCIASSGAGAAPIDDYNLAVKFYQQKRFSFAADLAADFLKASPNHEKAPLARLYLGQSLAEQKKYREARDVFRDFVKLHPEHKEVSLALYRIGESSHLLAEPDSAERELKTFLSRYPKDELAQYARLYLGETYLAREKYNTAAQEFQAVLNSADSEPIEEDARMGLARSRSAQQQWTEALTSYEQIVESGGRRAAEAQFAIGSIYYERGDFAKARETFEAFEAKFPGSALLGTAQLNAGYAAYQLQDFDAAKKRFHVAKQRPEQELAATYWLALTSHAEGEFANAATAFESILSKQVDGPDELLAKSLFYLGDSRLRTEAYPEALAAFQRVLKQYPNSSVADNAAHEATDAALRMQDYEAATQLNEVFATRYAKSPFADRQKLLLARSAVEQVEADPTNQAAIEQAEKTLKSLFGISGGVDRRARLELARLYQMLDRPQDAITAVEPMLGLPDSDEIIRDARLLAASLYLESNEPARASGLAKRVLSDTDGQNRTAREYLARAEAALGKWQQAKSAIDALPEGPSKTAVLVDAAESAFAAKEWNKAATWFEAAVTDADAPVAAFSGLAYSRFEQKNFVAAADAFGVLEGKAVNNQPLGSVAAWMRGLSLQNEGRTTSAQRVFEAGVASFATSGEKPLTDAADVEIAFNAYQMAKQAARIARDAREHERAERYYEVAVAQLQKLPQDRKNDLDKLINEWALLAYENEEFDRSDELFAKLLTIAPESEFADDAKLYLAESDFFAGNVDAAAEKFKELAASEKSDAYVKERSSVLLLDIAADQQNWEELTKLSQRFEKEFPSSRSQLYAKFRLGEAQLRTGQNAAAITTLKNARQMAMDVETSGSAWLPSVWVFLAEAAIQERQYALVEELSVEFAKRFPESPFQYLIDEIVGRMLKNQAEFEKAREAFARVTDSETGRRTETAAKSQLMIAETWLLQKNFEEALKAYYKVYVNYAFPEYQAPALYQAASCDESLQQWAKAAETYKILIDEFPSSEFAKKAQPRLEAAKLRIP